MNAVIDIGNTRFKVGLFENYSMVKSEAFLLIEEVINFLKIYSIENMIVSTVRSNTYEKELRVTLSNQYHELTNNTKLPIKNAYESSTIGMDRIASVIGAVTLFPNDNCLTIDFGTCLTHNLIESGNIFIGGGISLGYKMRLDAVAHFTQKLPKLEVIDVSKDLPAKNTNDSIILGIYWGMIDEINGLIERYSLKYPDLKVLITGGDAAFFEKRLKQPIFVSYDLNLIGLNRILQYNVE
jgi:type III pantothenate kinase